MKLRPLADVVNESAATDQTIEVTLTNELVHLLSDQLYHSPIKAIEELVVNSFDAGAKECRAYVPSPAELDDRFIAVYDDGAGMDFSGLTCLWRVGSSNKRDPVYEKAVKRKQIGKFGIGKLATYAVARRITYITRTKSGILAVTLDYDQFAKDATGKGAPVAMPVREFRPPAALSANETFARVAKCASLNINEMLDGADKTWTLVILESLKPKAANLAAGRLKWVLGTAMPLQTQFRIFLNGEEILSSKAKHKALVRFGVEQLPADRIANLLDSTGENWELKGDKLFSPSFPNGVGGVALITEQVLTGKSDDIGRSHGFFVRVRGRLVNEGDAEWGLTPRSYGAFSRFRADVEADDLDLAVTAPREGLEDAELKRKFGHLLNALFNEARTRYENLEKERNAKEGRKREGERTYVDLDLIERPLADVLASDPEVERGGEADASWFYLKFDEAIELADLVDQLYTPGSRTGYKFSYANKGRSQRLVQFDPANSIFLINEDHDLVKAHFDDGRAKVLLEDIVVAEAMLEVYLREHRVAPTTIGEVLERRDALLRSLAKDHPFSLPALAAALRDARANQYDLEIELVAAARALGFVAKHISGAGQPDGVARFSEFEDGSVTIILEAKASDETPTLAAFDFAGLARHVVDYEAAGCLLIAPDYPGNTKGSNAAAAQCAREQKISCWTIGDLARVVQYAEARHINAKQVLDIVRTKFEPEDVAASVEKLFSDPARARHELYRVILDALEKLHGRLRDKPRAVDHLLAVIATRDDEFANVDGRELELAVRELVGASQGILALVSDGTVIQVKGSLDEVRRRLVGLTRSAGEPRRPSTFKDRNGSV